MLVDVELPVRMPPAVTLPLDALVDSGARARVYVERGEGVFEPREVETGWRFGDRVEVLRGVEPGDQVVAAATFLVDSESRLKTPASGPAPKVDRPTGAPEYKVAAKMVKDPSCGMLVDPTRAKAAGNTLDDHGVSYYFCSKRCKETFQKTPTSSSGMAQAGGR
jgi:YHS domain-containing protein